MDLLETSVFIFALAPEGLRRSPGGAPLFRELRALRPPAGL
jgi:hypothetical protein